MDELGLQYAINHLELYLQHMFGCEVGLMHGYGGAPCTCGMVAAKDRFNEVLRQFLKPPNQANNQGDGTYEAEV